MRRGPCCSRCWCRDPAGRPADHHDRCRELSGLAEAIQGPWLMDQMGAQAEHGHQMSNDTVVKATCRAVPSVDAVMGRGVPAETVIATGAQAKWLGLESRSGCRGRRFRVCHLRRLLLSRQGSRGGRRRQYRGRGGPVPHPFRDQVTLVHRREDLRAEKILQERLFAHPKIEVIWNCAIEAVLAR